jgi:hypothetical protein
MNNVNAFRFNIRLCKEDRNKFQGWLDDYNRLKEENVQLMADKYTMGFCKEDDKQILKDSMNNYIPQVEVDSESQEDNVNHPKHYEGNIECIDAMQEVLGKHGTISFCIGNAFKYIWRCKKKHPTPIEDLKKCRWYIDKALELLESEDKNELYRM